MKAATLLVLVAGAGAMLYFADRAKTEKLEAAALKEEMHSSWCRNNDAERMGGFLEHGKTTAFYKKELIGKRLCEVDASIADIDFDGEATGLMFSPKFFIGNVVCAYPIGDADIESANKIVSSVSVAFTPKAIKVDRRGENGESTTVVADCHAVMFEHYN